MDEIWVPAAGWEDWLAVSTRGRVRTIRRVAASSRANQPTQIRPEQTLRPHLNHAGYATISTKRDGRRTKQFVHVLVARAFVPGWFEGATVDHIDGRKTNNLPSNLEWVTRQENTRRQNADGRGVPVGELHPAAKITNDAASAILERRAAGERVAVIADELGVSMSLVYKIASGLRRRTA